MPSMPSAYQTKPQRPRGYADGIAPNWRPVCGGHLRPPSRL